MDVEALKYFVLSGSHGGGAVSSSVSWKATVRQYGTGDQCFEVLFEWRWSDGFIRQEYGGSTSCRSTAMKLQQCNQCHRQVSITAGMASQATKLSLLITAKLGVLKLKSIGLKKRPDISIEPSGKGRHDRA